MSTATAERPTMAKRTNDVSTKIDATALALVKKAAEIKEKTVAEYLSLIATERASADLDAWAAERVAKSKKK